MAIICVSSLNQVVRKKAHNKCVKEFKFQKNNNNLVCPHCGVHLDRKDVKIWLDEYNHGECPGCFKKVHFDSINPRGPRGGREYYESKIEEVPQISSVRIKFLDAHLKNLSGLETPLNYLKAEEIIRFTQEDPDIVYSCCRKKWPIGRPSKEFKKNRQRVLQFLNQ